jgi:Hom_end-associated Hint/ATPase family associated with various cellular activities (AAA)/LAGLIDADG-like domain
MEEYEDSIDEFMSTATNEDSNDEADSPHPIGKAVSAYREAKEKRKEAKLGALTQYASFGGAFTPTSDTIKTLPPDCYTLQMTMEGNIIFKPQKLVTDSLMRLPDSKSDEVIAEITKFWNLKDKFKKYGFAHKRGFLLWGPPGCHNKGTKILMSDGTSKQVEDILIGDKLMGPDSEPRTVLELRRGRDKMVKVTPTKGEPFIVNYHHMFHLEPTHENDTVRCALNISAKDLIENTAKPFKDRFKLVRKEVKFEEKILKIPPYILGLWLGDGTRAAPQLTSMDEEIATEWCEYGKSLGLKVRITKQQINSKASSYQFSSNTDGKYGKGTNTFINLLKHYKLWGHKFIPQDYLTSSREQRLELLAGLIDTDGSTGTGTKTKFGTGYDYITKDRELADNVVFLSRSLGLAAYIRKCIKGCYVGKHKYFEGEYFRIYISGDASVVPTKLGRKQCKVRKSIKDVKRTGFTLEVLPEDAYYGFTLDRDHLYLTSDFTVHHNSGKTSTVSLTINDMVKAGGIVLLGDNPSILSKSLAEFRAIESERPLAVILEDIDTIIANYGESGVLSILDGEAQVENVVFLATTNYPERLDGRVINRPSRFDRVVKIGMPNDQAREMFLLSKLGTTTAKDSKTGETIDLIKVTDGFSIAHIKEMIISAYCQENPIKEVLERLKKMKHKPSSDSESGKLGI